MMVSPTLLVTGLLVVASSLALASSSGDGPAKVRGNYIRPDISPAVVLRARGYKAKEFVLTLSDGYKIHLIRATNPLINNGRRGLEGSLPILFAHATISSSLLFVADCIHAKPDNFRLKFELNADTDPRELHRQLGNNPASKCLPALALNFGYEVWLFNRRGFSNSKERVGHENRTVLDAIMSIPKSLLANDIQPLTNLQPGRRGKFGTPAELVREWSKLNLPKSDSKRLNNTYWGFWGDFLSTAITLENLPGALTDFGSFRKRFIQTFDPAFWDFSLDESVDYDVPETIDFVLRYTNKTQLHTVGLSAGAAALLLTAAAHPETNAKMASAVLWAPSLNMGTAQDIVYQLANLALPITQTYDGPIVFTFMQEQVVGALQALCSTDYQQRNICSRLFDILLGYSGHQAPVSPAHLSGFLASTAYRELAHLGQMSHTSRPCRFNFDPKRNLEVYNQLEAPCYDMRRVRIKYISIYSGNNDLLVSAVSTNTTRSQLGVPSKLTMIDEPGIQFNHAGSITHEQTDRLVLVPSLVDFERAQSGRTTLDMPRVRRPPPPKRTPRKG